MYKCEVCKYAIWDYIEGYRGCGYPDSVPFVEDCALGYEVFANEDCKGYSYREDLYEDFYEDY